MHELGLAEDVLVKIKEEARKRGLNKVTFAKVQIGETLITDPPEFRELFNTISAGSLAEGINLETEIISLRAECAECKSAFIPEKLRFDCPQCGATDIRVVSGREINIIDLR